jgi:4'-phosphopantetheinyl transferase
MAAGVEVWLLDGRTVDEPAYLRLHELLSASERERLERFVRPLRQRQFVLGRALLRRQLGKMLGIAPGDIELAAPPSQAPQLIRPVLPFASLSVSHSGPWVACAASVDMKLGLDIEVIDPQRDIMALAAQSFNPGQVGRLSALQGSDRIQEFYAIWCEQEARIKSGSEDGYIDHLGHPTLAIALCRNGAAMEPASALVEVTRSVFRCTSSDLT